MTQSTIKQMHQRHFIESLGFTFPQIVDGFESNGLDLSDFGNVLGQYLNKECNHGIKGFEIDDFMNGLKHGITKI